MLIFKSPWMLLTVFPIIAFVLIAVVRIKPNRWHLTHGLLVLCAALAVMAGAGPYFVYNRVSKNINVIVDHSAATQTAFFRHPRQLQRFITRHVPYGTHIHMMLVGNRLQALAKGRLGDGGWPAKIQPSSAAHLNWMALTAAHLARPTWIFTSPFNQWPVAPPAQRVAVTIFHPHQADVGVADLHVHRMSDGRVNLGIVIRATGPVHARLEVQRNSILIAADKVDFQQRGMRTIQLVDHIPPSDQWLHYRVQLQSHDPWPLDNHASGIVPPLKNGRILWVGEKPWKPSPNMAIKVINPSQLPTRAAMFIGYQCVVLHDVAAWNIHASQVASLARWVRDDFGGLVIAGAYHAFGAGGYGAESTVARALNALSPLSSHLPRPSPVGIVFLLDASGSMGRHVAGTGGRTRFDLAVDGILGAMHLVGTKVPIHVLAFSGRTIKISGRNPEQIKRRLLRIAPNGPTRPDTALPILRGLLHQHDWLILLTDGGIPKMSPLPWEKLLRSRAAHMVIIAGRESRSIRAFLHAPHVRLLLSSSEIRWRGLLQKAAMRVQRSPLMHRPLQWITTPGTGQLLAGTTQAWVRTYIRRRAVLLAGNLRHHIPIAAYWRIGLGKVAAVAFTGRTSADAALLHMVIHSTSAPAGSPHWRLALRQIYISAPSSLRTTASGQRKYLWRLRAWTYRRGDINRKVKAILFDTGHQHAMMIPMIAPGVFQTDIPSNSRTFFLSIMSARQQFKKPLRYALSGRIWPVNIPGPWFPATALPSHPTWRNCIIIHRHAKFRWRPLITSHFALATWFWLAAAVCGLSAMVMGVVKAS